MATTWVKNGRLFPYLTAIRAECIPRLKEADHSPRMDGCAYITWIPTRALADRRRNGEWARSNDARLDNRHDRATATAQQWGTCFDPCQGPLRIEPEQEVKPSDQPFAIGVQEAEVTGASEPFGQRMLEDQPQERRAGDRSECPLFGVGVSIAEGHLAVLASDNLLLPDHAAIEIAPQVNQCLLAATDGLAVHHPGVGIASGKFKARAGNGVEEFGTKHLGQG